MKLAAFAAALLVAASPAALAQTASHDGAVLTYQPDYFATYNPVTARDMVSQVPGFAIRNGADVRGLADSFANVLVDGERQNTKSESINEILGRIPAASVDRIELVREAVPGIDMRGQNRVVNVVLKAESGRSTTLSGGLDYWVGSGLVTPMLRASTSWEVGNTRISLGGVGGYNMAPRLREESLVAPDGSLIENRAERTSLHYIQASLNGSTATRFDDGSRLDTNLSVMHLGAGMRDRSLAFQSGAVLSRVELFTSDAEQQTWEAGATYERPFSERWSGQITLLNNGGTVTSDDALARTLADGSSQTTFFLADVTRGEHVVRSTVNWEASERHSLEFGAEAAFNYRDNGLAISVDTGGGPVPVALPVANTRVEERRGELFASHVWSANDNITVESGFRIERSQIEQSGDATRERAFTYPKPRVSLTWNSSEETQWQFTVERSVAQLSFGEFASEVDPRDDQVLIGNPELEPQKTWRGTARWERRWGEEASLALTLTHEEIEDVQDYRPVILRNPDNSTTVRDAPGNIGDGSVTFLTADAALPLDRIGISNARLDVSAMLRHSAVTDPTSGETRRLNRLEDWRLELDFRQDLVERDLAWGWSAYLQGDEDSWRYDNVVIYDTAEPQLDVFVESTAIEGVTLKLVWGDILSSSAARERRFYDGSRADQPLVATEYRQEELGGYVALRATRTF